MTVTNIAKDPTTMTMSITSEFDAPIDRVWSLWQDPRQLERWWGPPGYPATVVDHDLTEGGTVKYFMTGPEGDEPRGWWRVLAVDPPHRLEFEDGFADDAGNPNPAMPTMTMRVTLSEQAHGGTHMLIVTIFPSVEAMDQMISMGMEEGMALALGQVDELLRSPVAQP
jgi:uncharacterized protein YndB with AHSA1/START domain